ncbi:hypothetical protein PZA11_005403 [Diplocarpon coronariae]
MQGRERKDEKEKRRGRREADRGMQRKERKRKEKESLGRGRPDPLSARCVFPRIVSSLLNFSYPSLRSTTRENARRLPRHLYTDVVYVSHSAAGRRCSAAGWLVDDPARGLRTGGGWDGVYRHSNIGRQVACLLTTVQQSISVACNQGRRTRICRSG